MNEGGSGSEAAAAAVLLLMMMHSQPNRRFGVVAGGDVGRAGVVRFLSLLLWHFCVSAISPARARVWRRRSSRREYLFEDKDSMVLSPGVLMLSWVFGGGRGSVGVVMVSMLMQEV